MCNTCCLIYCDLPPPSGSLNHSSKHLSHSELEILFLQFSWLLGFSFWTPIREGFYFLRSGSCFLVCILRVCREGTFALLDFLIWKKKGKVHRCPRDGAVSPQSWWTGIPGKEEPEEDPIQTVTNAPGQRNRVEREVGGVIGMGNTCNSMADSCQCMTKPTEMLWSN